MHYIVNVTAEQEKLVQKLVSQGRVSSPYDFINIALSNQFRLEFPEVDQPGELPPSTNPAATPSPPVSTESVDDLLVLSKVRPPVFQPLVMRDASTHFLWGQYYRFLPVKVVLRALAHMSSQGPVKYADFVSAVTQSAIRVGQRLRTAEGSSQRPERISSTFPTRKEASVERFRQQYIANYRPGKQASGLPVELALETVSDQDGTILVGLTRPGAIFALQENPVLDKSSTDASLDTLEQLFLVEHIRRSLPREFEIMVSVLRAFKGGLSTPRELDTAARAAYGESAARWTDAHLTTMRAGLVSRMWELGLVKREWSGRRVSYRLTEDAGTLLSGDISRFTDAYKTVFASYEVTA